MDPAPLAKLLGVIARNEDALETEIGLGHGDLTLDGYGERSAGMLGRVGPDGVETFAELPLPHSLATRAARTRRGPRPRRSWRAPRRRRRARGGYATAA